MIDTGGTWTPMTKPRDSGTRYIWYDKVGILKDLIIVPMIQRRTSTILSEDEHGTKVKSPLFLFLVTFFFLFPLLLPQH